MATLNAEFVPYSIDECYAEVTISGNIPIDIYALTFPSLIDADISVLEGSFNPSVFRPNSSSYTNYGGYERVPLSAANIPDFTDDFYHRIHIIPEAIDFGVILAPVQSLFIVWNAYFVDKLCSVIDDSGFDNLTVNGLTAPFTLAGLGTAEYTVLTDNNGQTQLAATRTFTFPEDEVSIAFSGIRTLVFRWRPQGGMTETLQWLTDVIKSRDGTRQRIALRSTPRQSFQTTFLLDESDIRRLNIQLHKMQKKYWGFPVWPEYVIHTADIDINDTEILLDTANADFRAEYALIWQNPDVWEAVTVSEVQADRLVLTSPVQNNFTGEKLILPLRVCYMNSIARQRRHPSEVTEAEITFTVLNNIEIIGYTPAETINSIPFITEIPHIDPTQDIESNPDVYLTDFMTGMVELQSDSNWNDVVHSHLWFKDSKADAWAFRKFLHYLKGRQKPIYKPTYRHDMILTDAIGPSDTTFNVENLDFVNMLGVNDLKKYLYFQFDDETTAVREITGVTAVSSTKEQIQIDSALAKTVNPGEVKISFIDLCILNSDDVSILWDFVHRLECQTHFAGVEQ